MTATATKSRTRKPRTKPERRVTLYGADSNPMLIEMTIGKESFAYFVKRIHADYGMGFEFTKCPDGLGPVSEDVYHVHYDPARRLSTCDCKGGEFHRHCKHQETIVALIRAGKIAAPQQPAPEPIEFLARPVACSAGRR